MEISIGQIENKIHNIRGLQVMLDTDLAEIYQVETKVLNQAVKRNLDRFPNEFRFQLTNDETKHLKSQIVTSSASHGGRRVLPYVFTEQGVAMLSAVHGVYPHQRNLKKGFRKAQPTISGHYFVRKPQQSRPLYHN